MPSTHKKVIVRKLNHDSLPGYVGSNFIFGDNLELLNTAGNVMLVNLSEIKAVYFVREFGESVSPARKTFTTRPRAEGLWVRVRFRDNEMMEGMMVNDIVQASPAGYLISPPDTRSNTQRIFIPRAALSELKVLAVIGAQPRKHKPTTADERQREMFEEEHPA